jgi:hypothetical protein
VKLQLFSAAALALVLAAPVVSTPAAVAAPAPSTAPVLVRTIKVKVDDDKSRDTVKLYQLSQTSYLLRVITKRATFSVVFTSDVDNRDSHAADVWYGTSNLDGVTGSEIILRRFDAKARDDGDNSTPLIVFSWRAGLLLTEAAPAAALTTTWRIDPQSDTLRGYHFFNRSHRRYVDALVTPENSKWTTVIRSVWSHGHWKKLSKRRTRVSEAKADALSEFSGTTILRNKFRADLDGDGAADSFTYSSTDGIHFVTRIVTAKGKKLSKTIVAFQGSPLLGAAHFDGVAGTELAYIVDGEAPEWKVYTWRKGKLVAALPPSLAGETPGKYWDDGDTDDVDSLVFSVVDNVATATAISYYSDVENCYDTVTSQWRLNTWVKTAEQVCAPSVTPEFSWGIVADFVN